MNAVDDAVECIRRDVQRAGELQFQSNQSVADRVSELDERLFALDKEMLKVKLALPSAVAAQIAVPFTDRHGSGLTGGKGPVELPSGSMALQQKLQELSSEIATLYVQKHVHLMRASSCDLQESRADRSTLCGRAGKQTQQLVALRIESSLMDSRTACASLQRANRVSRMSSTRDCSSYSRATTRFVRHSLHA